MIDSIADTLVCDIVQFAAWQSEPAYTCNRELIAPEIKLFGWFREILQKIFGDSPASSFILLL